MQTAYQKPREIAFVLSLPAGRERNAGLNELASRYQRHLEYYIQCELKSTHWSQHLDAEDLVQSLYLKLLTVEPQEQIQDERHLLNWLQCVLRNHMLEEAKALVDANAYTSFVAENWTADQLMAHFLRQMQERRLLLWGTGAPGKWRIEVAMRWSDSLASMALNSGQRFACVYSLCFLPAL